MKTCLPLWFYMILYFMIANEKWLRYSGGGPVSVILNSSPIYQYSVT